MRKSRTAKEKGKSRQTTELDVLNFLPPFQDRLEDTLLAISISYVNLTRQCIALLKAVIDSKKFKIPAFETWISAAKKMKKKDFDAIPENSADVTWIHMVLQILREDMDKAGAEKEAEKRGISISACRTSN